jgi:hypothetical protein
MSAFDNSFICGVIEKIKPKKIVEIGVASGFTSAVILDALEEYSSNYKLYSLDLNKQYYRNQSEPTGYVSGLYKKKEPLLSGIHEIVTGKYAPESIEIIGADIDLLIIDTVHTLPGEILDFVAFYPYLSNNAFIVLHDIMLNHSSLVVPNRSYATKVLFDVVKADKYLNLESSDNPTIPNIAAFQINDDTKESILDLISSLTLTWEYFPSHIEMQIYTNVIEKNYDDHVIRLWNSIIARQQLTMQGKNKRARYSSVHLKHRSILWFMYMFKTTVQYLLRYGPRRFYNRILYQFKQSR